VAEPNHVLSLQSIRPPYPSPRDSRGDAELKSEMLTLIAVIFLSVIFLSVLWTSSVVASSESSGVQPVLPPMTGACCNPYGVCTMSTLEECTPPNTYLGDGTSCSPNPCPVPLGACCMPDGSCVLWTEGHCFELPWMGPGTTCDPNPCVQPSACCLGGVGCQILGVLDCLMMNGTFLGGGVPCDPDPCGDPTPRERESWGRIKSRYR
jgi:hypothetical protein